MNLKTTPKGFTLVELLLAMAIVSILAAGVIGMLSSHKNKAKQTKALAELSALVNPILMCRTDGGTINTPSSGASLCSLAASYGTWPSTGSGSSLDNFGTYSSSNLVGASWASDWSFYTDDSAASVRVCCNGTSNRCGIIDTTDTCSGYDLSN